MKVLKTPEEMAPKVEWTKTVICPMCGALLEYTNLDVFKKKGRYNDLDDAIICGHCNRWFCVF